MKSKNFFLYNCSFLLISSVVLLFGTQSAVAQTYPLTAIANCSTVQNIQLGNAPRKTVEFYQFGAVSYYEYINPSNSLRGCFMCYNPTDNLSPVKFDLPADIHVTDFMQIMSNDEIVFCGWKNDNVNGNTVRKGVIGWFEIMVGFSSIDLYYMVVDDVSYFEAVDTYYDSITGSIEIVAIAKEVQSSSQDGFFHIQQTRPMQQTSWSYNLYKTEKGQHFWNIVGTKDYEVFVGVGEKGLCLRREWYHTMTAPVELHNVYNYPVPDGEPSTKTKSTLLGNRLIRWQDDIVIGSPTFVSDYQYEARFRVINTTTMDMINSQKFNLSTKMDMYGLCYTMTSGMLPVLMSSDPNTLTNYSSVVLMKPYNTSIYTANYLYSSQYHFLSIDCLRQFFTNNYQFVLSAFGSSTITWFEADDASVSNTTCHSVGITRVMPIGNVTKVIKTDPLVDIGTTVTLYYDIISTDTENTAVDCIEP